MLIEGLRAELPELFDVAARLRKPSIPRSHPWVAAIAALGVITLSRQLLAATHGILLMFGLLPFRSFEATTIAAYALGSLFAFGAARWRGLATAVGIVAMLWIEQFALSIPPMQLFCARSDPSAPPWTCDFGVRAWNDLWPITVGVGLAIALRGGVRRGARRRRGLALAIGIGALTFPIARLAIVPFVGLTPQGPSAGAAFDWIVGVQLLSALVVGMLAGVWGRHHLLDGALIAGFYLMPWLPSLRNWLEAVQARGAGFVFQPDWQVFIPVGYALAAVLGLAFGALVSSARSASRMRNSRNKGRLRTS